MANVQLWALKLLHERLLPTKQEKAALLPIFSEERRSLSSVGVVVAAAGENCVQFSVLTTIFQLCKFTWDPGGPGVYPSVFLYMGPPRALVWSTKIKKKDPYFLFQKPMSGLNAHVWWTE